MLTIINLTLQDLVPKLIQHNLIRSSLAYFIESGDFDAHMFAIESNPERLKRFLSPDDAVLEQIRTLETRKIKANDLLLDCKNFMRNIGGDGGEQLPNDYYIDDDLESLER